MIDDLDNAITEAVNDMAECAFRKLETEDVKNAIAILNEWTTSSGECVLTHHFQNTLDTVDDLMIYSFVHEKQFGYGKFSFDPNVELVD